MYSGKTNTTMTTNKPLGIALIGCGGIALANHIPGVLATHTAKIVALCDSDAAALQRASAQTGIANTHTNYADVLALDEVDAVIIATPNFLHTSIAMAAIRAGKHVMCEKPIAMSAADAMRMAQAADATGVRHMTAFTYRFVPAMRYITHLVHAGFPGHAISLSRPTIARLGHARHRVAASKKIGWLRRTGRHALAPHRLWSFADGRFVAHREPYAALAGCA